MERRRKCSRLVKTIDLLPSARVLMLGRWSLVFVLCSLCVVVEYADCIMAFPEDSAGVYSLFPDEDLKTGRKRFRFEDDPQRSQYREGREYSHLVRSYPMLPHDRLHRPVDYSTGGGGSRQVFDNYRDHRDRDRDRGRERHGRVYFDDDHFRTNRFEYHRLTPRPRPGQDRPVSPIIFETSRRPPPYRQHLHPPPVIGQSKLPPGAGSRVSGEDDEVPARIHVFDPNSNSFGNPRNAGATSGPNTSSERTKGPPSNFVETGPPGPESFLNHEQFLEYQKKIALSRFQEQETGGGNGGSSSGKKVLFESKEPFEIDGLSPPDKSSENSGSGRIFPGGSPSPPSNGDGNVSSFKPIFHGSQDFHNQQHNSQRSREGQRVRGSRPFNIGQNPNAEENDNSSRGINEDSGGGEVVESEVVRHANTNNQQHQQKQNEKGEVVESENGKSEVTQLPPTHHHHQNQHQNHHQQTKSGRVHSGSDSASNSKKFTPSISLDENVGRQTGFKLPTRTTQDYNSGGGRESGGDNEEPPNLHGFVPVVPFHLIGAEPPRAISLERQRQQQQQRIVPIHHGAGTVTPRSTTTSTHRPSHASPTPTLTPPPPPPQRHSPTTPRAKAILVEQYSGFRPAEVSRTSSTSSIGIGTDENSSNNSGDVSLASPILHATAGERSLSETHSKVAITKQQELKRLQKQKQLVLIPNVQLTRNPATVAFGLFPEIIRTNAHITHHNPPPQGGGEDNTSSISISSSEPVNRGTDDPNQESPVGPTELTLTLGQQDPTPTTHNHSDSNITKTTTSTTPTPPSSSISSSNETITSISSNSSLHEHKTVESASSSDPENNELFIDTRTANGIRQGEFHLEGYIKNKKNVELSRSSSSSSSTSSSNSDSEAKLGKGSHPHLHGPPVPYDYPDPEIEDTEPNNSLRPEHRLLSESLDNEDNVLSPHDTDVPTGNNVTPQETEGDLGTVNLGITPPNPNPPKTSEEELELAKKLNDSDSEQILTGQLDQDEPSFREEDHFHLHQNIEDEPKLDIIPPEIFDTEPDSPGSQSDLDSTPSPELRVTRFTHPDGADEADEVTPTSTFYPRENDIISDEDEESLPYYPYYKHYGNKVNVSVEPSIASRSSSKGQHEHDDDTEHPPEDSLDHREDDIESINRLSGSYRHPQVVGLDGIEPMGHYENTHSIDIPLQVTLNLGDINHDDDDELGLKLNHNNEVDVDGGGSVNAATAGDDEDYRGGSTPHDDDNIPPLYLESSETLMNKTYYLDRNNILPFNRNNSSKYDDDEGAGFKSMNFIKVTRIKVPSGPQSKETSEKTSSTILARRTAKPAVIVSTTAAGARPRIVGSVVEAGPAWPGLVSNFIRGNNNGFGENRPFTATATVRPKANLGTHPATPLARQVQADPEPPRFRVQGRGQFPIQVVHIPDQASVSSLEHEQNKVRTETRSTIINSINNSSVVGGTATPTAAPTTPNTNAKLIKHVISSKLKTQSNPNPVNNYSAVVASRANNTLIHNNSAPSTKRLFSSAEEYLAFNIASNSSTGVVSMVHAHISHCPKLHSPTEVICDVHIREGHGLPNPQLTVGWRRKFYNSTQPDVLLALNKAPASGENGEFDPHHSVMEIEPGRGERLEEFHDKFNVTLAPGISPMLRSVLLIRSVTAPDCGTYQCEVNDGINVLTSETLLFLCH